MENERKMEGLSLEGCFKKLGQSFNRVKYFVGIIDTLDVAGLPDNWNIKNPSGIDYEVQLPAGENQNIVDAYKYFMKRHLVRDVIESFALSLDEVFFLLLLDGKYVSSFQPLNQLLSEEEDKNLKKIQKQGISDKFKFFKEKYNIQLSGNWPDIIESQRHIRNCLSHSNGNVRKQDGTDGEGGKRKFTWKTMEIFLQETLTGKEHQIKFGEPIGFKANICLRIKDHSKEFNIGEQLSFSSGEVYEIAWNLMEFSKNLIREISKMKKNS